MAAQTGGAKIDQIWSNSKVEPAVNNVGHEFANWVVYLAGLPLCSSLLTATLQRLLRIGFENRACFSEPLEIQIPASTLPAFPNMVT